MNNNFFADFVMVGGDIFPMFFLFICLIFLIGGWS